MQGDKEPWKRPAVFSPENAGPWLILLVVLSFQIIAALPRLGVELPPALATLIPVVLGNQYAIPD